MSRFLADPRVLALSVVATVMMPPPAADLNAWAEANIVFGRESELTGPYDARNFPFFRRVLDCLSPEHPARRVSVMGSAQIGKTTLAQIFIGANMDLDPCDMLYVHPTHDNAVRWARGKWTKMRRQSPALRRVFGEAKSRDARDTMLYQEERHGRGSLQISGANSPSSLSMISTPRIVMDDLSKWVGDKDAGDPEGLAESRAAAFEWAKLFRISTPLYADTCRITRAYRKGTRERWHVPCPHCNHYQPLEWDNMLASLDRSRPQDAHFTCVACGCAIEHRHKREIVARGHWVAEAPAAAEPSFHIWRAYVPTRDWASIAQEWFNAEGDPLAEQVFYNDVLGLPYERASDAPSWEEIKARADASGLDRGRIPAGGLLLVAGTDCQGDRTEVHIKAFGADLRRWTVDYQVIPHHIGTEECRAALDGLLKAKWPDMFGNLRPLDMLAIDGNAYTTDVFAWAKQHPWTRVIVVRGARGDTAVPLALTKSERKADGSVRKAQKRFYNVGVSRLKLAFYEHLRKHDPLARGHCGYPAGLSEEFYRQMTAEVRETVKNRWGYPESRWKLVHDRNEVLDTELYAEAAAIRCGWYTRLPEDWDRMRAERERPAETGQADLFDPAAPLSQSAHAALPAARAGVAVGALDRLARLNG